MKTKSKRDGSGALRDRLCRSRPPPDGKTKDGNSAAGRGKEGTKLRVYLEREGRGQRNESKRRRRRGEGGTTYGCRG